MPRKTRICVFVTLMGAMFTARGQAETDAVQLVGPVGSPRLPSNVSKLELPILAETSIRAAFEKAKAAKIGKDYDELLDTCQRMLANESDDDRREQLSDLIGWTFNRRGEAYAATAARAVEQGNQRLAEELDVAARRDFERAVERNDEDWEARHNRAISYAAAGRFPEALQDLDLVIESNKEHVNARFNRAEICSQLGDLKRAVKDYDYVLKRKPDDTLALAARGFCLIQLDQTKWALKDLDRAIELDSTQAAVFVDRGDAHLRLENWSEAMSDFRRAIELDDQLAHAFGHAAWLAARCPDPAIRDPQFALMAARRAIRLAGAKDRGFLLTLMAAQSAIVSSQNVSSGPLEANDQSARTRFASHWRDVDPKRDSNRPERSADGGLDWQPR